MKGNKFLAAVLAASMALSVAPATALNVFAANIAANSITVENAYDSSDGTYDTANAIDRALEGQLDLTTYWDDAAKDYQSGISASDVKGYIDGKLTSPLNVYKVDETSIKITNSKVFTFNVYNTNDGNEVYTVNVKDNSLTYDPTILDDYFKAHTFTISNGDTFTSHMVAEQLKKQNTAANDPYDELASGASTYTFSGSTAPVTVTDGKATGTITVIADGTTSYTYTYTANVTTTDTTAEAAKKAAISQVNANTYPMYSDTYTGSNGAKHNLDAVKNKITADLTDAGYPGSVSLSNVTVKAPTKTANGYLKATVDKYNSINVTLAYSSDSKSADTEKSVNKVLKATTKNGPGSNVTQHKTAASGVTTAPSDNVALALNKYYAVTINDTSKLSQAVQAKTATTETKQADVIAAVQKAIEDQLASDGNKDNGVGVSVDAVNIWDGSSKITAGHTPATTSAGGTWTLLVTTSIDNEFNGYTDSESTPKTDSDSKTEVRYLVTLHTNKLSSDKATAVSLADKTSYISKGYSKFANKHYADTDYSYVEMKAALTPETSNTAVTYKVADSKGNVIMSKIPSGKILDVDGETTDTPFFAEESNTALTASDGALGIMVTKPGTYTVTATAGDLSATATLTIKKNFDDVPATSYYADAAVWAYGKGITAGTSENTFGSNDPVTRAQYVTWLYKYAVSLDPTVAIDDDDVKSVFSDVATTAYYAKAVQWAKENGITAGTTATTFSPDRAITRAQAIQMLWVAKGRPYAGLGQEDEKTLKFTDVPDNAYYKTAVKWAVEGSVTAGTSATTFGPNDVCRRSQAIQFIYMA